MFRAILWEYMCENTGMHATNMGLSFHLGFYMSPHFFFFLKMSPLGNGHKEMPQQLTA